MHSFIEKLITQNTLKKKQNKGRRELQWDLVGKSYTRKMGWNSQNLVASCHSYKGTWAKFSTMTEKENDGKVFGQQLQFIDSTKNNRKKMKSCIEIWRNLRHM